MAKKEDTVSLIDTFAEFKENRNIDRATLVSVLEESFRSVIAKMFGSDENYDVIVNPDKGDFEIYRNRTVVADEEVHDSNREIPLTEARKIDKDYELGEEVSESVDFARDFGRRAILTLRQTLASKLLELEHDSLYNKYKDKVGQVVSAEVYQVWKKEMLLVDDEGNELLLPKTEQIPGDFYRKGEAARAVVLRVDNTTGCPKIILSRTSPVFLQRLLEAEVPEIHEGQIVIRRAARIPGERAKIAVESFDERIEANPQLFITRALSPARVNSVKLNESERKAEVYLDPDQVSLAIGKSGMNIKLASMLTEYTIDVFREIGGDGENDDVYLDEFAGDIDPWIIEELKKIGMVTAKDVLGTPRETLITRADLEEETVDEVLRILREEFEE